VASPWFGIAAPAGTPEGIVEALNDTISEGLSNLTLKARFEAQGVELRGGSPAEFRAYLVSETQKWTEVLRKSGLKPQ
jgi:tripartite-type tricarboxylate transporter receptor subunit TctC